MPKLFRSILLLAALCVAAPHAAAGELVVKVADGRATVIAKDVPLSQVLAEWARVGSTRIVNAEKMAGGSITLELVDIPEKEALDILLRSAAGYMTAPRAQAAPGASLYDRIVILATSTPPANPPPVAAPFGRPLTREAMPQPLPEGDDNGEPSEQNPPPPGMPFPPPEGAVPAEPAQAPAGPVLAPRPGVLPQQPQPAPIMPYAPVNVPPPGTPPASRPGPRPDGGPG